MKKKLLYSPRVHASLIPTIYYTAQARGMPMTDVVNGYVYRGLATETLPLEALTRFPTDWKNPLTNGLQRFLPEGNEAGASKRPVDIISERAKWVTPFSDLDELDAWRNESIEGLARAYAAIETDLRTPNVHRSPAELNSAWLYETYALNVQAAYTDALPHIVANSIRLPYSNDGGDYRGRAI